MSGVSLFFAFLQHNHEVYINIYILVEQVEQNTN